jgi:hypothetical protein
MKRLFLLLMVFSLVALYVVPAMAGQTDRRHNQDPGCNVNFDVNVDKGVRINEHVDIDKCLDLHVRSYIDPNEWAQCEVYKCDVNKYNDIDEQFLWNRNELDDSFHDFSGIAQVNQSTGSLNNQGNAVAVAATDPTGRRDHEALSHTEVAIDQENTKNELESCLVVHTDKIDGSFCGFSGVAQVNQTSGYMNNQNNVVGISANLDTRGAVALTDSFLTQKNSCNEAEFRGVYYSAKIDGSFKGGCGLAQVNQSPASMNNQANSVAISYAGYNR